MEIKKPAYHPDVTNTRKDVAAYAKLTKPARGDGPIAKREKERMRRILAGEDVESKDESMTRLGLHRRWGSR